jgi:hypothetical protein
MEDSGHHHAPAAFALEEEPPLPIQLEAGWATETVWT